MKKLRMNKKIETTKKVARVFCVAFSSLKCCVYFCDCPPKSFVASHIFSSSSLFLSFTALISIPSHLSYGLNDVVLHFGHFHSHFCQDFLLDFFQFRRSDRFSAAVDQQIQSILTRTEVFSQRFRGIVSIFEVEVAVLFGPLQ